MQKPIAAVGVNGQTVYAILDPDKPLSTEEVAERVTGDMSPAESWDALQELHDAMRAALAFGGWTTLS